MPGVPELPSSSVATCSACRLPRQPLRDVITGRRTRPVGTARVADRVVTESEDSMRLFIAATVALLTFGAGHPSSPSNAGYAEQSAAAASTPLTVLSSNGFQAVMEDLAPRFEKAKHQK